MLVYLNRYRLCWNILEGEAAQSNRDQLCTLVHVSVGEGITEVSQNAGGCIQLLSINVLGCKNAKH